MGRTPLMGKVLVVSVISLVSFAMGRYSASTHYKENVAQTGSASRLVASDHADATTPLQADRKSTRTISRKSAPSQPDPSNRANPSQQIKGELTKLSNDAVLSLLATSDKKFDQQILAAELKRRIEQNPEALNWALDRFQREGDIAMMDVWAQVLGRVRHNNVREVAINMAIDTGRSKDHRLAALRVLEGQHARQAVTPLNRLLEQEQDSDILKRSIYALPVPRGYSTEETRTTAANLARLSEQSGNEEIRRTAVLSLGDWGQDRESRSTVVRTLQGDRSAKVRAAAAFSLIHVSHKDEQTLSVLAAKLQDGREDGQVREFAWRALRSEPTLSEPLAQVCQRYAEERDQRLSRSNSSSGTNR